MGGEDQEQKHVCKFCKKSFPCGRSLGGHMRSHISNNNTTAEAKNTTNKLDKKKTLSSLSSSNNNTYMADFEAGGHAGYGLRENPKKTWRLSDSIDDSHQENKLCKECGKGFQSWKALFGHMRCHSERERVSNLSNSLEDDSWTAQSDNEAAAAPRRRRRSRRTSHRATTTTTTVTTTSSCSVSEIEQEQEEVAMCLMMLSRDVGCWGNNGLNSVAESSDNNSVVMEVRSSGLVKRISENGDQSVKMKRPRDKKLESVVSDSENVRFERKISESGVEVEVRDAELGKNAFGRKGTVKCCEDQADGDSESGKYNSSKKAFEIGGELLKKMMRSYEASDSEIGKDFCSPKKSKFECTTCNKIFHSYQALGGHRASHKKIKGCFASKIESSENSIETEVSPNPTTDDSKLINESPIEEASNGAKKNKHECPICFKIFSSGQALGGHKRSHMVEGSEARANNQTIIIHHDLLDLNLPAPIEEDNNDHFGLKEPWWIRSNHKREAMAGLFSH